MANLQQLEDGLGSIKIGLRKDLVVSRQLLRGDVQYVIHDPITFSNHMFPREDYRILMALISGRSLRETFEHLVDCQHLEESDRLQYYEFILRLHGTNLLQLPITNAKILYERSLKKKAAKRQGILKMMIYHKVPLIDPDQFLGRTVHIFGKLFTKPGLLCWAALMFVALWKCWGRFGELFAVSGVLLELSNVPVLLLALVGLKIIHEFGHAYACKRLGGEVPEMGMVFILGAPCAYVDASSSWKFSNAWQRIMVGLGGMFAESIVAAIFALVWVGTQPGFWHDVSINVLVLASLVTVLFNINPLMRFDGYYIFGDLTGMPNLSERSIHFIRSRLKWLLLGLPLPEQDISSKERWVYWIYGISASIYKIFLAFSIYMMLLVNWPMGGAVLGITFGYVLLLKPLLGMVRYLLTHEETEPVRLRARTVAWSLVTLVPAMIYFLPISLQVSIPGVLEPENRHVIRAPTAGFIADIRVADGETIDKGRILLRLENPMLRSQRDLLEKRLQTTRARIAVTELTDPVQAAIQGTQEELLEQQIRSLNLDLESMTVTAPDHGRVVARLRDRDSFVHEGDELLEFHAGAPMLLAVFSEEQIDRADLRVGSEVQLRWAIQPGKNVKAVVMRILPMVSREGLPGPLTVLGGGQVYGTSNSDGELRADQPYLRVLMKPASVPMRQSAGLSAQISFPAEVETMGSWLMRRLRTFYNVWRMS